MKYSMKRLYVVLVMMILLPTGGSFASDAGQLRFSFQGDRVNLDGEVTASVTMKKNKWLFTIAARSESMMFTISGDVKGPPSESAVSLDSSWNRLSVMLVKDRVLYSAAPVTRFVENPKIEYAGKNRHGRRSKTGRYQKRKPYWNDMDRSERIRRGRGIVRNSRMEGSRFTLALKPELSGGEIVLLKGTFEGILVRTRTRGRRLARTGEKISGTFMVEVKK